MFELWRLEEEEDGDVEGGVESSMAMLVLRGEEEKEEGRRNSDDVCWTFRCQD